MASLVTQIFDPEALQKAWGSAAAEAPPGGAAAPSPALRLLERLTEEARSELGVLGPALEQLFGAVRAQLEREDVAAREAELVGLLEQIEDLLEARVRW